MKRCSEPKCNVPDVKCHWGEDTPAECSYWNGGAAKHAKSAKPTNDDREGGSTLLPWTGSALGTRDLAFLTGRGEPKLVALIGAHNAGKTTMLAAWYQKLGRSGMIGDRYFAGSFSFEGWEAVAHALRWEGGAPAFPPHTPSGARRSPGMLHFALRAEDGTLEDYLFADSPGEWFERWAVDRLATDAAGARWLSERASALIVIADCEALSGPERGSARSSLINLLRRTAAERGGRPVALVWAKADKTVSQGISEAIREAALKAMPDLVEFEVSMMSFVRDGAEHDGFEELSKVLDWALLPLKRGFEPPLPELDTSDPFFQYGIAS